MTKNIFLIAIIGLLTTSCATIFTGTRDKITFNSTPQGAIIYKDGVEQCITPCTLNMKRSLDYTDIEYKLDGYETRLITLDREFNIISILNFANVFGWVVDGLSGAVFKYDSKTYNITLSKDGKTSMIYPSEINIDTKNKVVEVYVYQK